jgi:opacity protein-like surface antigen
MKNSLRSILLAFFILSSIAYGQNIKYGFSFGLTYIAAPGYYTDDIDTTGKAFGLKSNYHFGGKIKIGLQQLPLRLTGSMLYTSFNGSKNNVVINPTTAIDIETSSNLFTLGFGVEYLFNPEPVSPYATLELQFNAQGNTKLTENFPNSTKEISIEGNSRWGLGLGLGIDLGIVSQVDLDAGIKYNLLNIFGKRNNEDTFSTFTFTLSVLYNPGSVKK